MACLLDAAAGPYLAIPGSEFMQRQLDSILDEAAEALPLASILSALADREARPVDCQAVEAALRSNPLAAEVEKGVWIKAERLVKGRSFFAIPEADDVRAGRVCCVGSDLFFLMRVGASLGRVILVDEHGQEIFSTLTIEDTGYFFLAGLEDWYSANEFSPERDSVLLTCLDYEEARYGLRRLPEAALDEYVGSKMRTTLCTWLATLIKREPARLPGSLPNGFSISGALRFLLHDRQKSFQNYPCNLSFFLSLDERFLVTGNQFVLRSAMIVEDFTEHYIGQEGSLLFEPQDIARFNRALEALFELENAKKARELFVQLVADYPQEKLLHKYIYQAAWQLDDFEAVRRHANIYHERFPRDPDALCTLAEMSMLGGDYSKAHQLLLEAEALVHPDDRTMLADIMIVRMRLFWETENDEGAIRIARRLLALEPDNEEALAFLEDYASKNGKPLRPDVIKADFSVEETTETGDEDE